MIKKMIVFLKKQMIKKRVVAAQKQYEVLDGVKLEQVIPSSNTIVFVIPSFNVYGGGATSIMRLASFLREFGMDVYFYSVEHQNKNELIETLEKIYPHHGCKVIEETDDVYKSDNKFVCATSYFTALVASKIKGYKLYFVQDYEPFFSSVGDDYFAAKKSYELGYHIISLGPWNKNTVLRYSDISKDIKADYITFPFEPKEYEYTKRDYSYLKDKKEIKIAVYSRSDTPRRMPGLQQYVIDHLITYFANRAITITPFYFGDLIKHSNGVNLGRISRSEINKLYEECDFGMCMSATNLSLAPFEMMNKGLPLIDFFGSSIGAFISTDCLYVYDNDSLKLCEEIEQDIQNPTNIDKKRDIWEKALSNMSWRNSAKEFYEILQSIKK